MNLFIEMNRFAKPQAHKTFLVHSRVAFVYMKSFENGSLSRIVLKVT